MNSQPLPLKKPLCEGKAFRFAPGRQGKPVAFFWKFWACGNEVYATTRSAGKHTKISVHESGQIHMRIEERQLNQLAPPLFVGNGQWLHAFELRFLVSPGAYSPIEKLKGKRAFLIDVPFDKVLIMNLLIGQTGCSIETELPQELLPAVSVWQTVLRNQCPITLIGRVIEMDKRNRDEIEFIRRELNPKANFREPLTVAPYIEVTRVVSDPKGGNIILVVPMGKESFRMPSDASSQLPLAIADARTIIVSCPSVSISIAAPNGAVVGTFSIAGTNYELTLQKNVEVRCPLGTVTLSIDPSNLICGQSFSIRPIFCRCAPTVDGSRLRSWEYSVFSYFDGTIFRVEIRQLSISLPNVNFQYRSLA